MPSIELADLIFKGSTDKVNITSLVEHIFHAAKNVRTNYPEAASYSTLADLINFIKANEYIDLSGTFEVFTDMDFSVPNVFADITINGEKIEFLMFFDLGDLKGPNLMESTLSILKPWALDYQVRYGFDYVRCQIDNGNDDEYYFDTHGTGPFIHWLDRLA